jgi:hypothetical protein
MAAPHVGASAETADAQPAAVPPKTYYLETYGCQVLLRQIADSHRFQPYLSGCAQMNESDSEIVKSILNTANHRQTDAPDQVILELWRCSFEYMSVWSDAWVYVCGVSTGGCDFGEYLRDPRERGGQSVGSIEPLSHSEAQAPASEPAQSGSARLHGGAAQNQTARNRAISGCCGRTRRIPRSAETARGTALLPSFTSPQHAALHCSTAQQHKQPQHSAVIDRRVLMHVCCSCGRRLGMAKSASRQ